MQNEVESVVLVFTTYIFFVALAEILSKRELSNGLTHYYVHYIDCEYEIFCVLYKLTLQAYIAYFGGHFASKATSNFGVLTHGRAIFQHQSCRFYSFVIYLTHY